MKLEKNTLTTEAMIADAPEEKGGGMDMGGMGMGMKLLVPHFKY